ncbi:MAG: PspC domain-containing protein [Cyclobacteriaceae bacterium]|nr:PspC domain-containing protein [Cyclobacteriaceae bacterium]
MKKNISINISGIIFHIEEDGYDSLRKYLDSVNRYFGSFEDSSEILADIESRIAEIFLTKLSEGKQVITAEDVQSLIATMGSVNDFKAAEEQDFAAADTAQPSAGSAGSAKSNQSSYSYTPPKRLFRDTRRKILGGICAGLAHYFNVDPIWLRLISALLVLGSFGGLIIVYIVLWIFLPASDALEETTVRKMFRDPEKKVVGGVAAGVAAFFNTDVAILRVLFVVFSLFSGIGLIVYLVLWISLPEARTITEKMQMQGEPVTLSNIENTVKKGQEKPGEEDTLTKIILFPFRMIAEVLTAIAKAIGPVFAVILDVIRIMVGVFISLLGFTLVVALIFTFGVSMGLISSDIFPEFMQWSSFEHSFPVEALRNTIPTSAVVFGFLLAFIPSLMILLLGNSIIAKRVVFGSVVGWTLFGLFFVSALFVSVSVPRLIYGFKETGEYKVEQSYTFSKGTPVLRIRETGMDDYDAITLILKPYDGKDFKLVERFESQGSSRKIAAENAKMVSYMVEQQDSVLVFDSNIVFSKGAQFRAQRLAMDLYVPRNQPFVIEEELWRLIRNNGRHDYDDLDLTNTWMFTERGMSCLSCKDQTERPRSSNVDVNDQYGIRDFDAVDLSGIFTTVIQQGPDFAVELKGDARLKERYDVRLDGETLVIEYDDKQREFWKPGFWNSDDELRITITMPRLRRLDVQGAGKVRFNGFDEEEVEINMTGAVSGDGNLNVKRLDVDLTGASSLELDGHGDALDASLTGASSLKAFGYEVREAAVEAHGASSAKVNATERLEIDKGVACTVNHRGNPEIIKRD